MYYTPASTAGSQHFLIVEPDPLFRLLVCIALAGESSDFHAVACLDEALALLAEREFSAVIAEYHLPGGTGMSLYEHARRVSAHMPFILMCGGDRITLPDRHFRFFAKPFGLSEFADSLAEMIAGSRGA
ncbi:MAG TPA: response regulator [Chthoniobacteraceae bacterium]|jgi:DNA-binding NtrC family response regulator|nr:response regulator [Chthoniobacteraceae bacterium]